MARGTRASVGSRPTGASAQEPAAVGGGAQIWALVVANARFWRSVAPLVHEELAGWRALAAGIEDAHLRELALAKLTGEAFNAEVAATLATLAPRPRRAAVVKAIVALEVLFDYLDGRTEALFEPGVRRAQPRRGRFARSRPKEQADWKGSLEEGRRLSRSLIAVIDGEDPALGGPDRRYLESLWRCAYEHASALPGFTGVARAAHAAASRCAEAQLRLHAAPALGEQQLRRWATESCRASGLGWREYVGGCASSVLAMHALIATAARADVSEHDARTLDECYLAVGAVITTLDGLVDQAADRDEQKEGYIRLYEGPAELEQRLLALVEEALARAARTADGAHHAMTLAGVAAYYTTHAGAGEAENRRIVRAVRAGLAPAIWPALTVLATWRAAKQARRAVGALRRPAPRHAVARAGSGESHRHAG